MLSQKTEKNSALIEERKLIAFLDAKNNNNYPHKTYKLKHSRNNKV